MSTANASKRRPSPPRINKVDLEAALLEFPGDPAPTGRRLNRDRGQLAIPLTDPLIESLTRRLKPALGELARIRIKHHRLKHTLVNIVS